MMQKLRDEGKGYSSLSILFIGSRRGRKNNFNFFELNVYLLLQEINR